MPETIALRTAFTAWPGFVYVQHVRGLRRVEEITGYVCTLPLTKKAAADILAKRRHVNELTQDDLVAPGATPSAVYIGAVCAMTEICQSIALQHTIGLVKRLSKNRGDTMIITRPVSKTGLRLVESFGLAPVDPHAEGCLNQLHAAHMNQLLIVNRAHSQAHQDGARQRRLRPPKPTLSVSQSANQRLKRGNAPTRRS